MNNTKVQQ